MTFLSSAPRALNVIVGLPAVSLPVDRNLLILLPYFAWSSAAYLAEISGLPVASQSGRPDAIAMYLVKCRSAAMFWALPIRLWLNPRGFGFTLELSSFASPLTPLGVCTSGTHFPLRSLRMFLAWFFCVRWP